MRIWGTDVVTMHTEDLEKLGQEEKHRKWATGLDLCPPFHLHSR